MQGQENPIYRICLTGGPCAGKTTALNQLKDHLGNKGFKVFVVPEVPTLTMEGGGMIVMGGLSQEKICQFQGLLMKAQMDLEDYFYNLAVLAGKPSVILYDRGVMDPKAYMDEPTWQAVLDLYNYNAVYLRDKRYQVVLHMVTAADGAEKFYTLENNAARYEDAPTARIVDKNLQNAWAGHPHHIFIDNSGNGFEDKIKFTIHAVEKYIGLANEKSFQKKFIVKSVNIPSDQKFQVFDVEESYVKPTNGAENQYLRKRGTNGAYSYTFTQVFKNEDGTKRVVKSNICAKDYVKFGLSADDAYIILKKQRTCFLFGGQSYILDKFVDSKGNQQHILKVELASNAVKFEIPSWIQVGEDVSENPNYSNSLLAQKQ